MFRRRLCLRLPFVAALSACAVAATMLYSGAARAQDECPLGSVLKTEGTQTWCEPTVCEIDNQCPTGSICRPVPLCVEIGALEQSPGTKTDAGQKVLVRQRCGVNKSCPQNTVCSEKGRCITRAQADKAGLSVAPSAAGSAAPAGSAGASGADAPKKACGCHVPGTSGGELGGAALAMLGVLTIAARRRRTKR